MSDGIKYQQAKLYANTLAEPDKGPLTTLPQDVTDPVSTQRVIVKDGFWKRLWKKFKQ